MTIDPGPIAPITTDVDAAAEMLRSGGLVAFPTETVYGLGADAADPAAVSQIFAAKGRPSGHPLIVHLASVEQVASWTELDATTEDQVAALADACWPGPLTVIVPRSDRVAPQAVGGRSTIGLRIPDHPVALALLRAFGGGVAAPSANRFGRVSPTRAEHVVADLGDRVDLVLDGGASAVGVESTIIELGVVPPAMLRPGGVTIQRLRAVLGTDVVDGRGGESRASGMLTSHYAPAAAVEIVDGDEAMARLGELATASGGSRRIGLITPGSGSGSNATSPTSPTSAETETETETAAGEGLDVWRHTLPDDAVGFAAGLYDALRRGDAVGVDRLLVVPPRRGDLLEAILDRLGKAAAPRR